MSKPNAGPSSPPKDDEIMINGKRYCQFKINYIFYSVSSHKSQKLVHLLIEVPMVVLLEMTSVSLRSLIEELMCEALTIIKSPTFLL